MKRILRALMIVCSVLIIAFSAIYIVREFTKVVNLSNMGDMWSFLALRENSPYAEFAEVDTDDFPSPPFPQVGDLLFEIDGKPSTLDNYFSVFNVNTPAGETIPIKFLHDSEVLSTDVVTRSIPFSMQLQVWLLLILRTLIVAGLIFVGVWGLIKQPYSSSVRALTLFCFTLAVQMNVTSPSIADVYAEYQLPMNIIGVIIAISIFSPALWLKLQMLFPEKKRFYLKHRLFLNLSLFLPGLIFGAVMYARDNVLSLESQIYATLFMLLGYMLLLRNYRKAETFIQRRQIRLVLWGSAPGLIASLTTGWIIQIKPELFLELSFVTRLLITNIQFLLLLLIPISFAYAFGKYKLLEVEGKLKRGTRFVAVSLSLLLVFLGLLYVFGELIVEHLGIESQTPTLILGLLLAFLFLPTQKKLRNRLEKYFYPERARLKELLKNFLASNIVRTESSAFWKMLEEQLADGLSAERIYPVLRMNDKECLAVEYDEPTPFFMRDEIVKRLESRDNPVLFDELVASGRIILSPEQREWFTSRKSAILLPLVTKSGLVGFLVISCKTNGEDFTSEELELLGSFSAQTALVAENFELLNEKLIKQKLEEQLRVGREIQKGLLPGSIPDLPGLEIEALIRFCLDVAGDYYDVISLDEHRTVLSIGDVAGKGVGPAMLMANLQASLRTTQAMGVSLQESARKINSIVFDNTPTDIFITFFMALIDTRQGILRYVNAGHNPPFIINADGKVHLLSRGGILLGVERGADYAEGEVEFNPGDILLMYTDGVCEAMDCDDQEYGEKRLTQLVLGNRDISLSKLLHLIEGEVCTFQGSDQYADDFTLLAARPRR